MSACPRVFPCLGVKQIFGANIFGVQNLFRTQHFFDHFFLTRNFFRAKMFLKSFKAEHFLVNIYFPNLDLDLTGATAKRSKFFLIQIQVARTTLMFLQLCQNYSHFLTKKIDFFGHLLCNFI